MDVLFFFKRRAKFIRYFYTESSNPFHEIKQKIGDGDPPFDSPTYNESGEPPYMEDWVEAENALEVLGRNCISMLSASLKLYFIAWESKLDIKCKSEYGTVFRKKGPLHGYRECFGDAFKIPWQECPVNLDVIEQVFLIRNKDQHPDSITTLSVSYTDSEAKRLDSLFFVGEAEKSVIDDTEMDNPLPLFFSIFAAVRTSREKLFEVIDQVELFAEWLEEHMLSIHHDDK